MLSPVAVATEIAARSADPAVLAEAVAATARQSRYADLLPWRPAGLAQGHAGIAVLCAELDAREPGAGWDRRGHHHLSLAVAGTGPHDVSLFSGLAGVGFAALRLAGGRPRYTRLLDRIDAELASPVARAADRLAAARGCAARDLDLVSGLTGVGVYLLTRRQLAPDSEGSALVEALSGLARMLAADEHPRRWHTPIQLATGSLRDAFPGGHHNCGLAHGGPGPLSLLSLGVLAGVEVRGAAEAIEATASWLAEHHAGPADEPDWPDAVPLDHSRPAGPDHGACAPGRAAWCYGTPGVARSLWLAGAATGRPQWPVIAAQAIRAIARRAPATWLLSTPTFCHGEAGLLQVLHRFAADLADPEIAATAAALADRIAARFDPDSVLGVRGIEPEGVPVDHPGLLDGAPGVALALLGLPAGDIGDSCDPGGPGWDRMFLLS